MQYLPCISAPVVSLDSSSCCCACSHPLARGFIGLESCASMGPQAVADGGKCRDQNSYI